VTLLTLERECSLDTYSGLQLLDLLLATLHGDLFRFIQAVLQVLDGLLHVLFHALQVSTASLRPLSVCSTRALSSSSSACIRLLPLQGIHNSLLVPLIHLHFLIFLHQLPFNVSFHLIELQLSSQDLALLML
uniref:Uncharacterized protein n=1 Tax=Hucho hucho TaxID=62062 RepID=A0A4W5NDJ8_9TELE